MPKNHDCEGKNNLFHRLKNNLLKTHNKLRRNFVKIFSLKKIEEDLFPKLEEQLLMADVGIETTNFIIDKLAKQVNSKQLQDTQIIYNLLKLEMSKILEQVDSPLIINQQKPFIILIVGVNGVGKTTTIGKLTHYYRSQNKSVMLAAGDTFRSAAIDQLQILGRLNNTPVIAKKIGTDPAAVIFDAIKIATITKVDILIADTAGRLQNKQPLMEELKKITKIIKKKYSAVSYEIMLTIDANTGQNAIIQAELFNQALGITGITITKLDGTSKGGMIFAIANKFKIPFRYLTNGNNMEDLQLFGVKDFIEAIFPKKI